MMSESLFEGVFYHIDNKTLANHMDDALNYALQLESLSKNYPEPLRSMFHKTQIIHIASVVEALLHYAVLKLGHTHYRKAWEYPDPLVVHKIDENTQVVACKRVRKKAKLSGYVDFAVLNRFCRDQAKIYGQALYKKIDKARLLRNKIHLAKLEDMDRTVKKSHVTFVANVVDDILGAIEKKFKTPKK